jgi:hypothetical protein
LKVKEYTESIYNGGCLKSLKKKVVGGKLFVFTSFFFLFRIRTRKAAKEIYIQENYSNLEWFAMNFELLPKLPEKNRIR